MGVIKIFIDREEFAEESIFRGLITKLDNEGTKVENIAGQYVYHVSNEREIRLETYLELIANGVEVEGFKTWIYADASFLDNNVFEGISHRNGLNELTSITFSQWGDGNITLYYSKDNTKVIIPTFWSSIYLTEDEVSILLDNGVTLFDISDMDKWQVSSEFTGDPEESETIESIFKKKHSYNDILVPRQLLRDMYFSKLTELGTDLTNATLEQLKTVYTVKELKMLSRMYVLRRELRQQVLGEKIELRVHRKMDKAMYKARKKRYVALKRLGEKELPLVVVYTMAQEFDSYNFKSSFVENGIEGDGSISTEGLVDPTSIPTILDYIKGQNYFDTKGIPSYDFTPKSMSKNEFIDLAYRIINYGDFQ